jgi:hypothetical protein
MKTQFIGESYLQKLADLPLSQMGQPNQGLNALSGAQYNWLKRLHQHPDLAVALHKVAPHSQSSGTQMSNRNPELEDPYAKFVDPASVRAAKKYLPKLLLDGKIQ